MISFNLLSPAWLMAPGVWVLGAYKSVVQTTEGTWISKERTVILCGAWI